MAKKKQNTPLSLAAIAALRSAVFSGNSFKLLEDNLECYAEIKDLLETLGGSWMRGEQHHAFAAGVDARALVIAACDRGVIPASNPNDYFPTPADVVSEMVSHENFSDTWEAILSNATLASRPVRYLEPSGGTGALAEVMAARMRPGDELVIVEINPILAASLRQRLPQATVVEDDFMNFESSQTFDVVLMNPPFAGKTYIKHVRRAFGLLRPRGILASIVPSSFRDHDLTFVYSVVENGEWHDLGGDRFEGTSYATSILWLNSEPTNKWREFPHEGYSTHHGWEIATSISNDADALKALRKTSSFEEAVDYMRTWTHEQVRQGSAVRVDEAIAREVIRSIFEDHEFGGVDHLRPNEAGGQLDFLGAA